MTAEEAIANLTERQQAVLLKLWGPTDAMASTIDTQDILELRLQGLLRRTPDGRTEFTELGRDVCQYLTAQQQ